MFEGFFLGQFFFSTRNMYNGTEGIAINVRCESRGLEIWNERWANKIQIRMRVI